MDKERIDGFRSAFAPGETLFWQVPAAARERMAFYSENLPRLFLKKLLTTCKLTIKISLSNKKRQLHIYSTVGAVGYIPEYVIETNILGFQLPFFLYYDYGLNAFNCQAICYFIVAYSAWLFYS
mgnify:CR=1 FL=1